MSANLFICRHLFRIAIPIWKKCGKNGILGMAAFLPAAGRRPKAAGGEDSNHTNTDLYQCIVAGFNLNYLLSQEF